MRLQRHRHPQQRGDHRQANERRANRELATEAEGGDAGEGEDEGGIPEGEVHNSVLYYAEPATGSNFGTKCHNVARGDRMGLKSPTQIAVVVR